MHHGQCDVSGSPEGGSLMSVKYDTTCTTTNEKFNNEKELFIDYFS